MHRRRSLTAVGAAAVVAALATSAAVPLDVRTGITTDSTQSLSLSASVSGRSLQVREGDSVVATYAVAVGKGGKPTPTGAFSIRKIVWNPTWVPPDEPWAKGKSAQPAGAEKNPMKLVKIFFQEPDYYIHGTDDLESLGSAASHGCLRMDPSDAAAVARYLMEHGGQPRDENWFWRVVHFRSETKTVLLSNPIQLSVAD